MHAVEEYQVDKFAIAGGLLPTAAKRSHERSMPGAGGKFYYPSPPIVRDNAAMIGVAAYYEYRNGTRHGWDLECCSKKLKFRER